mmetsp:Transcript_43931/g.145501  ORF Transcript_43931/g.145501 Transcript_43931/m.145501 type:complete len:208 (-) Transcript_43931:2152-2775(-)
MLAAPSPCPPSFLPSPGAAEACRSIALVSIATVSSSASASRSSLRMRMPMTSSTRFRSSSAAIESTPASISGVSASRPSMFVSSFTSLSSIAWISSVLIASAWPATGGASLSLDDTFPNSSSASSSRADAGRPGDRLLRMVRSPEAHMASDSISHFAYVSRGTVQISSLPANFETSSAPMPAPETGGSCRLQPLSPPALRSVTRTSR